MRSSRTPVHTKDPDVVQTWSPATAIDFDHAGKVHLSAPDGVKTPGGQLEFGEVLDLIAPFSTAEGARGPDLYQPRPELRILPGKLSGSPHVAGTRLETRAIGALAEDGYSPENISALYPYLTTEQIDQSINLSSNSRRISRCRSLHDERATATPVGVEEKNGEATDALFARHKLSKSELRG